MAIFNNPGKDWEKYATDDDIREMEAQGCDMSEIKEKRAKEEAAAEKEEEDTNSFTNPTDLSKLTPYLKTPRDMDTPFFKEVAGKEPWLFKGSWKKKYTESPVVYAAVVEANSDLWMPGTEIYLPAVFVFAIDAEHMHNIEWAKEMADKINELKDEADNKIPSDCRKLINTLRDEGSGFCFKIGKSVAGDVDAWCATYKFEDQKKLPRKALPSDGVVPFLLKAKPVVNQFVNFKLIPSDLYMI